jgi:T-complex protein 1 subunit theta
MGDATNLVLILAGELLKRSEHLLTMGLHPSDVILGYEMALEKGREELECKSTYYPCTIQSSFPLAMVVSTLSPSPLPTIADLAAAIAPSIASKQPGSEKFLSTLAAEAALAVMPKNPKDFNVDRSRR